MKKFSKDEELKKLKSIYNKLPDERKELAEGLMYDAAFMVEELAKLREKITATGWAESVEISTFTDVSGNADEYISYAAAKGGAATAPGVYSNAIRVYQNGGTFTISANNGATITEIVLGSNQQTSVTYSIDGGTTSESQSIAADVKFTLSDISVNSNVLFTCVSTSNQQRLNVNYLKVTYELPSSKTATSLAFNNTALTGTVNKYIGQNSFSSAATLTPAIEGATISYTSSNTDVATIASDGTVTIG